MLVLSRKKDERVIIDLGCEFIVVTLLEIRGDKVRLGFDAPHGIPVHREEVFKAIHGDNQSKSEPPA